MLQFACLSVAGRPRSFITGHIVIHSRFSCEQEGLGGAWTLSVLDRKAALEFLVQGWGQLPTKKREMGEGVETTKMMNGGLWSEGLGVAGCSGSLKGRSQSPAHISELRLQDWTHMVFLGLCGWYGGPNSVPSLGFK